MCWHVFLNGIFSTWGSEHASLMSPALAGGLIRKDPGARERLKAGGEGDVRGWVDWMPSPTQWTWVWASSGSWWWTGKPCVLRSIGSQRVRHHWVTEMNWAPPGKWCSRNLDHLPSGSDHTGVHVLVLSLKLPSSVLSGRGVVLTLRRRTQRCISDCSPHLLWGGTGTLPLPWTIVSWLPFFVSALRAIVYPSWICNKDFPEWPLDMCWVCSAFVVTGWQYLPCSYSVKTASPRPECV